MNLKKFKVLVVAVLVIISALSFNFVVSAEPDDDSDFVITEVLEEVDCIVMGFDTELTFKKLEASLLENPIARNNK